MYTPVPHQSRIDRTSKPATRRMTQPPASILTPADRLLLALLAAALVLLCVHRSNTHLLWPDELLGYRLLAAPTLTAMLRGWYHGADGGGLLYYLTARLWASLFGLSALALRLFSTAGAILALCLTWTAARRLAPTLAVALAISLVFLVPQEFLFQVSDARFYGLVLAAAALAGLMFLRSADGKLTRRDLAWTALAHILLVGSHILGVVFSVALVLGMLAVGRRRQHLPAIAAAATGWLLVPLSWHAAQASASIAVKPFWAKKPAADDLITALTLSSPLATGPLPLLPLLYLLQRWVPALRRRAARQPLLPPGARVLVLCEIAAVLVIFARSQVGAPVFRERYLLPATLATTLLTAALLTRLCPPAWFAQKRPAATLLWSSLALAPALAFAFLRPMNESIYAPPPFVAAARALPPLPILATHFPAYTVLSHYDPGHTYLYLLDWPFDLASGRPASDLSAERLMGNVARAGLDRGTVLSCHEIFTRYPDLLLLTEPRRQPWLDQRIRNNPGYTLEPRPPLPAWRDVSIWSVHRVGSAAPPC